MPVDWGLVYVVQEGRMHICDSLVGPILLNNCRLQPTEKHQMTVGMQDARCDQGKLASYFHKFFADVNSWAIKCPNRLDCFSVRVGFTLH